MELVGTRGERMQAEIWPRKRASRAPTVFPSGYGLLVACGDMLLH